MRTDLPERRESITFDFVHEDGLDKKPFEYRATVGFLDGIVAGRIAEIFLNGQHIESATDTAASESATLASHLLQRGVLLDEVAAMLKRNTDGCASSPLGTALLIAWDERAQLLARLDDGAGGNKRDAITREVATMVREASQ
jgi:hypothetical protein